MPVLKPQLRSDKEVRKLNPAHVSLIVAMTPARVIGRDGGLPWQISADLRYFKATTMAKPIVMGRKTFASIGKPLPGRHNIVVSRNPNFSAQGVTVVNSLESALDSAGAVAEVMIIGGAQLYEMALPVADRLYLTWIQNDISGDTFFPQPDWPDWRLTRRSATQTEQGVSFYFSNYDRIKAA